MKPPSATPASDSAEAAFILAQTALTAPPLVPELRLHLATEVTPLWQATERELLVSGMPPPYWAFAWPGGQALARLLLDQPSLVAGKRVLDFAAGCGIAACAAMRAGAAQATATEIDAFACAAIALNARANAVDVAIRPVDVTADNGESWDVILAGDICYERPMAERAFAWLSRQAEGGALVLLADPGRAYLPAGLHEIGRYTVATSRDLEDREHRETRVFRLAHSAASTTRSSTIR